MAQITRFSTIWLLMSHNLLNNRLDSRVPRMPYRLTHGSCVNSVEDSTAAQNVSLETKPLSRPSMCRGLIRVSHSNRVSMGETTIRTKIKAKGGLIIRIRIIRTVKVMDGGTIRITCHHLDSPKTRCVKYTPMCASARVAPSNIVYSWYGYRSTGTGVLATEVLLFRQYLNK